MVEPRINEGLLVMRVVPLNKEDQDPNIAFETVPRAREKSCYKDQQELPEIHHYDLPIERVVIQANIEDSIQLQNLMVSKPSRVLSNFKEYSYRENNTPDAYQRQANRELHYVVDPLPASYTRVFPKIADPVLIVDAVEKRKAVVDNSGLPEQRNN